MKIKQMGVSLALFMAATAIATAQTVEFGGMCAMHLVEGQQLPTDCSITWRAGDKTYCFASPDDKTRFLKDAKGNLVLAGEFGAVSATEEIGQRMQYYTSEDVQAFVERHIRLAAAENEGAFPFHDAVSDRRLALVYEQIHIVRKLHGYGFFPNAVFHAKDDPRKKYWIDFWVQPKGDDELTVLETRIYNAPSQQGDEWQLVTRQPVPWWWIPASEHPGESEQKRGWEIMSAVDRHIIDERAKNDGVYKLKDAKTGKEIALEFIGIHQPVRRLDSDGRYFACTDFRKQGTENQYYDIDFWLNEESGELEVGEVRIHKVPRKFEGNWMQVPRYDFDGMDFEVVP